MSKKFVSCVAASAVIGSYVIHNMNTSIEATPLPAAPYGSFRTPKVSPRITQQGTQKVLCVMVNMADSPFDSKHDENYYYEELFGSSPDSVKNFVSNQSNNRFNIEPITTNGTAKPGIVKIDMENTWGTVASDDYAKHKELFNAAIEKAVDSVDLSSADVDSNKLFEESFHTDDPSKKEELLVYTIVSGQTNGVSDVVQDKVAIWAHLTQVDTVAGGYTFKNTSVMTSEMSQGVPVNRTILSHEFLHNLNARDMYKDQNSIGPWSVMCDSYGRFNGSQTSSPTPLDPIHKLYLGWAEKEVINPTSDRETVVNFDKSKVYVMPHPTDENVSYVIDYRDWEDPNVKALHKFGVNGDGVVIWKIYKDQTETDWNDSDWNVNSGGPRTSMSVLTTDQQKPVASNSYTTVGKTCTIDDTDIQVSVQNKQMTFSVKGEEPPTTGVTIEAVDREIEVGETIDYLEGVVVRDSENNIVTEQANLKADVKVDNTRPGEGTVTYTATYKGSSAEKTIKVTVVEAETPIPKPTIKAENRVIQQGETFKPLDGVTATDGKGEDITASLRVKESNVDVNTPGTYQVVYEVSDAYGSTTVKTITVIVQGKDTPNPDKDTTPPVIEGVGPKVLKVGEDFNPLDGVTATDDVDGVVPVTVVSSDVDTSKPGKYKVLYSAVDKAGNKAEHARMVEVVKADSNGEDSSVDRVSPDLVPLDTKFKLPVGFDLNPRAFVVATDDKDGDLTGKIKLSGDYDFSKPGTYTVNYSVEDKEGNKSECSIEFEVYAVKAAIYAPDLKIRVGAEFKPRTGVSSIASNGVNMNRKLTISGMDFDTSKPGKHTVKYAFTDIDGKEVVKERTVEVVESGVVDYPTIDFGRAVYDKGGSYTEMSDVTCEKAEVKVIGGSVDFNTTGFYPVVYEATDANGNTTQRIRNIVVTSTEVKEGAPLIKTINNRVVKGSVFEPKNAVVVLDYEEGLLNDKLVVEENTVNTNKLGRYNVSYSVVDSDANSTTKTVAIDVIEGDEDVQLIKPDNDNGSGEGSGSEGDPKPPSESSGKPEVNFPNTSESGSVTLPKTGDAPSTLIVSVGTLISVLLRRWWS